MPAPVHFGFNQRVHECDGSQPDYPAIRVSGYDETVRRGLREQVLDCVFANDISTGGRSGGVVGIDLTEQIYQGLVLFSGDESNAHGGLPPLALRLTERLGRTAFGVGDILRRDERFYDAESQLGSAQ